MRTGDVVSRPPQAGVHAGRGAAAALLRAHDDARTLVLVDAAVADRLALPARARVRRVVASTDLAQVRDVVRDAVVVPTDRVLAVGGGNTIDLATLAVAALGSPRLLADLEAQEARAGFVVPRVRVRTGPGPRLVVAPTTCGTGAEASSVACYATRDAGGPAKVLVSLPDVRPDLVCYDPHLLAGPGWLLREAVLEIATRVLGAAAESPSSLWRAELDAHDALRAVARLVPRLDPQADEPDDDTLLALATTSADTHAGWSLRGRGTAPSSSWFLAAELSTAAGLRKAQAVRVLLPAWLDELGDLGRRAPTEAALRALGVRDGLEGVRTWAQRLVPCPTLPDLDVDALVARIDRRFGRGRPMRRDLDTLRVRRVLTAALREPGLSARALPVSAASAADLVPGVV